MFPYKSDFKDLVRICDLVQTFSCLIRTICILKLLPYHPAGLPADTSAPIVFVSNIFNLCSLFALFIKEIKSWTAVSHHPRSSGRERTIVII